MRARIEEGIVYSPYSYTPRAGDRTFAGFLFETLTKFASKTALICGQEKVTYSELREKVWRCAAGFRRLGVDRNDRVYVHLANSIETFIAMCSVPLVGASLVSSDIMWQEDDIVDKIDRAGATAVLTDAGHVEMFARIISRCNVQVYYLAQSRPGVFIFRQKAFAVGVKRFGFDDVSEFSRNDEILNKDEKFGSGDCTLVKWTTGTTGQPKGAEYSEERFLRLNSCLV
ncbi:hypothetical protein MTO96_052172 [Rhipicephalus appendiculatus]